jgi:hypothetical protein
LEIMPARRGQARPLVDTHVDLVALARDCNVWSVGGGAGNIAISVFTLSMSVLEYCVYVAIY